MTREPFGADLEQLATPRYLEGYLPVVTIEYEHEDATYVEEAFAPLTSDRPRTARRCCGFRSRAPMANARCGEGPSRGAHRIRWPTPRRPRQRSQCEGPVRRRIQLGLAMGCPTEHARRRAGATTTAELAIYTKPAAPGLKMSSAVYDQRRQECVERWNDVLDRSIRLQTPEAIVNDAWRAMLIGNFMIAVGDRPHYSASNAYAKLYEGECGDTLRSFMLFGHLDMAPAMLRPMLEFDRQDTRFHVAGHKLQLLAYFYWLTRDADTVRDYEPLWRPAVELILTSREPDRPAAEGPLRRRHQGERVLAQLERQLLARPARRGRHAGRHGRNGRSEAAATSGRRLSQARF